MSDEDDDEREPEPEDMDDPYRRDVFGCIFPGYCCMPGEHLKLECHTAEMMETYYEEFKTQ